MKRVAWVVIGTLLLLVAVVVVGGSLLPREHIATTHLDLAATPDAVWTMITDVERYPQWRSGVTEVKVTSVPGERLTWIESWDRGDRITFRVTSRTPTREMRVDIDDETLPFSGYWTYRVEPTASGCTLHLEENGAVDNPVYRFISRVFMDPHASMNTYLDDLDAALSGTPAMAAEGDALQTLVRYMTGSFSSAAQAEADTNYFDIRLEMARIWSGHPYGYWLYVEQASARALEQPYRQRVYHVTEPEPGVFRSAVYTLESPLRFAGAWRESAPLATLSPDSLTLRDGCAVWLKPENGRYAGATVADACASTLRGASYATSEVVVTSDAITSWDRGYDATGKQVWGAENGPYVFKRLDTR